MGQAVWMHLNAMQEANRQYDLGKVPAMLVEERFDRLFFKDVVEAIFATSNRGEAEAIIQEYNKFWISIIGTRGAVGKKTVNASTKFFELFDESVDKPEEDSVQLGHSEDFTEDEIAKLDQLEEEIK